MGQKTFKGKISPNLENNTKLKIQVVQQNPHLVSFTHIVIFVLKVNDILKVFK